VVCYGNDLRDVKLEKGGGKRHKQLPGIPRDRGAVQATAPVRLTGKPSIGEKSDQASKARIGGVEERYFKQLSFYFAAGRRILRGSAYGNRWF
jgi:hypothetical protein